MGLYKPLGDVIVAMSRHHRLKGVCGWCFRYLSDDCLVES